MRTQLQQRLQELRQEFQTGQIRLRDLEQQEAMLRDTLLRISGAIQVLEEELAKADASAPNGQTLVPEANAVVLAVPPAPASLPR